LSEQQIDDIAERAAIKAVEKITQQIYRDIGHTVLSKFFWLVGASSVAVYFWLQSKGILPNSH
jgi:hypothetical protein